MTSRRRTKALRAAAEARGNPTPDRLRRNRRSLRLEGPASVGRTARRAKGFRAPAQPIGPARFPRAKVIPHPLAWVDPVTNEGPAKRESHTRFIRRAAKKNAPHRSTRAEILRSAREQDPTATRSVVSKIKRRSYRFRYLQDAVTAMIGRVDRVSWGDPVVPTAKTRAEGLAQVRAT